MGAINIDNNSNLVSVIIPVYNGEKYLSKCLDSIIGQTYNNIEIIIINDGSTDGSLLIAETYKNRDNRISIFSQNNRGLSEARNLGIRKSSGQFLFFLDCDDYIEKDAIEILLLEILSTSSDIVVCDFKKISESSGKIIKEKSFKNKEYNNEKFTRLFYKNYGYKYQTAWNKLYKKSLWECITFPKGRVYEDIAVAHIIAFKCTKIKVISNKLYNYICRMSGNISSEYSASNTLAMIRNMEERCLFFNKIKNRKLLHYAFIDYVLATNYQITKLNKELQKEEYYRREEIYKKIYKMLGFLDKMYFRLPFMWIVIMKVRNRMVGKR